MMYDKRQGGKRFRERCSVSLAWWHSFKWTTKAIMTVFSNDIIAPLFHYLFPTNQFSADKMKLTSQTTFLTYIRLAYPLFKIELTEAVNRVGLTVRQKTLLDNMYSLCEFFIPTVRILIYILVSYHPYIYINTNTYI